MFKYLSYLRFFILFLMLGLANAETTIFDLKTVILESDIVVVGKVNSFLKNNNGLMDVSFSNNWSRSKNYNENNLILESSTINTMLSKNLEKYLNIGDSVLFFLRKSKNRNKWQILYENTLVFWIDENGTLMSPMHNRVIKLSLKEIRYERFLVKPNRGAPNAQIIDKNGNSRIIVNKYPEKLKNETFVSLNDFKNLYEDVVNQVIKEGIIE